MSTTPDCIRIAELIIEGVRKRQLKPGEKLPSIAESAQRVRVSTSTIQMAYLRLEALRVIRRHQGKGVYVTDPATWLREP